MLPRRRRVHTKDIAAVGKRGRTYYSSTFSLKLAQADGPSAFTVVVSAKVQATAVGRNHLKRQVRHIIAAALPRVSDGYHGIFYAKKEAIGALSENLKRDILYLLKSAGILLQ